MKPANFPERKRQRQVRALERQEKKIPESLLVTQRGVRTKIKRADRSK